MINLLFTHVSKKSGTTYYLHMRLTKLKGSGKEQALYFFAKKPKDGTLSELPHGYEVTENTRTGLPLLKKKALE